MNGQTGNPIALAWQNWLMDVASGGPPLREQKVGNIAV